MATPLTATYRITMTYTPSPLTHKWRGYVKPVAAGPQPWSLTTFDGLSVDTWVASIQAWWNVLRTFMYDTTTPAPDAVLEQHAGLLWVPLDFAALTGAGTLGVGNAAAQQTTIVVRDTAFAKMRIVLLEPNQPYLGHSSTGLGLTAGATAIANEYNGVANTPADPYNWQVSRGNRYVLRAGAISGLTFDQNRKLKRARHEE